MTYLNYAALSPTHPKVEQEVTTTLTTIKEYLYSEAGVEWYRTKIQESRETVARLLHLSNATNLAFVANASTANHLLLSAITWNRGDTIVSTTHENPSIQNALLALQSRGVKTHFIPPSSSPECFWESLEQSLKRDNIKAIIISHVSHVDGRLFPIADIAEFSRARGIFFAVDGAQAVGHLDVNVQALNCDAYFFSGHKWCCGPLGTGGLIISDRLSESVSSILVPPSINGPSFASRFEIGTHNIGLIAGLAMACYIKLQEGLNTTNLFHIREFVMQELQQLPAIKIQGWTGPHAPGILTFQCLHPKRYDHLRRQLYEKWHIVLKTFSDYPDGECPSLRLSWSPETNLENVQKVLAVIKLCI